jgi:hypothetical protein
MKHGKKLTRSMKLLLLAKGFSETELRSGYWLYISHRQDMLLVISRAGEKRLVLKPV